jgi:hypothetical protein
MLRSESPVADAGPRGPARPERVLLWVGMIGGTIAAGVAFVYKIAEFIFTLNSNEVRGFADVPVTIYFVVAAGWLCLLVWCFVSGQFTDIERAKVEMLEMEEAYDQRGE